MVQPEKCWTKSVHVSRWTTFLGWTGPIQMDRSIWPFWPILNARTSLFSIFHVQNGGKYLSLHFYGLLTTDLSVLLVRSMYSCHRSVAASFAKCMFWLLMTLKDDLFSERIWNVLFIIQFKHGVWNHMERSVQNNPLHWLNYYGWSSSHKIYHWYYCPTPSKSSSNFNTRNSDPTSFVLNELETGFASGIEWDRSDLSRSSRVSTPRNFRSSAWKFWFSGLRPLVQLLNHAV